ncbi:MAG: AAA family ATPase [Bacteroidales bacterium]|nr:AAA family ATPase [Bacteroidales bacterium]
METYANIAAANSTIESFNLENDALNENIGRLRTLLKKPYFARIQMKVPGKSAPHDVYLGSVGVADERHRRIVVDWRAPIAEVYYNQDMGKTSYVANGKTIETELLLRRQFDIERDRLKCYFDTSVAIEDPLLLASLTSQRSDTLQAITATIQKEQNAIVRHENVPVLLVRGVAGSGKTSVLLQRIAFLLFRDRETLRAEQVYLVTPNPVFKKYISNVLPELGEKNPNALTWAELMDKLGPGDRSLGENTPTASLELMDRSLRSLELEQADMHEISAGDHQLLTTDQIWRTVERFSKRCKPGPQLCTVVEEDLLDKLDSKISQLAGSAAIKDEVMTMDLDMQERLFGRLVDPNDEEDVAECARSYIEEMCAPCIQQVENAGWLRLDRIGMRMLGQESLSGLEWLYLKMVLAGKVDEAARLVVIDEVQDYSEAQLMVLARYFSNARFLMLGDENQAIQEGTATFARIRELFEGLRGSVCECELMTSYRSSPEITAVFTTLMEPDDRMSVSSVRRPGSVVRFLECLDDETYLAEVEREAREGKAEEGIVAIVVGSGRRARWLDRTLRSRMGDDAPLFMDGKHKLPASGVVLIDLKLAKGLEFDRVVVADAQEEEYPDTLLSRHRLYTAISRATQKLTVLSQGKMTALLDNARQA